MVLLLLVAVATPGLFLELLWTAAHAAEGGGAAAAAPLLLVVLLAAARLHLLLPWPRRAAVLPRGANLVLRCEFGITPSTFSCSASFPIVARRASSRSRGRPSGAARGLLLVHDEAEAGGLEREAAGEALSPAAAARTSAVCTANRNSQSLISLNRMDCSGLQHLRMGRRTDGGRRSCNPVKCILLWGTSTGWLCLLNGPLASRFAAIH